MLLLFVLSIGSCRLNDTRVEGFPCDCFVYSDDLITEETPHGSISYIDPASDNVLAKDQLRNFYLIHYDTIDVLVFNENPKKNFASIAYFIKALHTDSTDLSEYIRDHDGSVRITIARKSNGTNERGSKDYIPYQSARVGNQQGVWKIKEETFLNVETWRGIDSVAAF